MYLLTFLTPSGDIVPTHVELVQAMGVPERSVRYRMERLMQCQWQGKPLVLTLIRNSGLDAFMVSPELITVRTAPASAPPEPYQGPRVASREAVIARSRATYAKPRREVEAMIARLNNWDLPVGNSNEQIGESPSDASRELQTRLMLVGVSKAQADLLLAHYPLPHIRDQLAWLPLRFANNPARFLVAAIEKNFAPPRGTPLPPPNSEVTTAPPNNTIPEVNEPRGP